ncbi:BMC_2a_G0023850.mRNA.1.CDS.1 [Saccharomyces cerevisiae]|nr:Ser2p [Saccharomyces cerevisiae YJM1447]CAI4476819.1 BMC_2a_G0023850.mRNA.1.CDS.1 [Saccharomyces cerevisiae]CAI4477903.1 BMB_G0023880.mRNA.1.CDS.1 [Saccharomyces cerevisiae]CAI7122121.1 BMC_2a_G0023850.mRNA.1.CDS.1 [Saccharomyces cerevisiae]CAI7124079.1 BMB_G0023880.mRNA.1.CDS.1 [Saccharomyces cerevisiae]
MSKFVITCIAHGENLPKETIDQIAKEITESSAKDVSINGTKKLSARATDIFIEVAGSIVQKDLKNKLTNVIDSHNDVDIIVSVDNEYRQAKKLFVFDMDSTLIYQEVIELIATYAGVEEQVHEITERAMNNELDFKESLRERVKLLQGLQVDTLYDEIKQKLEVTKGVPELCKFLHKKNCKLAVLSGGFIQFAGFIKDQLGLDFCKANLLEVDTDGKLTGKTLGPIVDGQCKSETLLQLCNDYNVPVEASCMVGDGGNDLPAMATAGFGIAWNAKPKVQKAAPCKLNTKSMTDILYILGYTDDEIYNRQ